MLMLVKTIKNQLVVHLCQASKGMGIPFVSISFLDLTITNTLSHHPSNSAPIEKFEGCDVP